MTLYKITCGDIGIGINHNIPYIISTVIDVIKVGVPILLIIFCMIDLGKIVVSSKEEEIKKSKSMIFKRLLSAILVFFVVAVTEIVVTTLSGNSKDTITSCMHCMINNQCERFEENNSTE